MRASVIATVMGLCTACTPAQPAISTMGSTVLPLRRRRFADVRGANGDVVLTLCTTDTLVGNRYLQYFAAYRWHDTFPH